MAQPKLLCSAALCAMLCAAPAYAQNQPFVGLGSLGTFSILLPESMSADGSVVAGIYELNGDQRGFRWENGIMIDLGTLGGANTTASLISANGSVIAGHSNVVTGWDHAFRWENGVMTDLGTYNGAIMSMAWALSADGSTVAGDGGGGGDAWRWKNGVMTGLGNLGGMTTRPYYISDDGEVIAGWGTNAASERRAFRWENGVITNLGTFGGAESTASALSGDGAVVIGESDNALGEYHAFRWENGVMADLGTLGGTYSGAYAMNITGSVIAGMSETGSGDYHGFRWENGTMTDIGTLGGIGDTIAAQISDDGSVIVGTSRNPSNDAQIFRWTAQDGMKSLDQILADAGVDMTGWQLTPSGSYISLSADGDIIGSYGLFNGVNQAFLFTMSGLITPQEFGEALTPAIGMPQQAMDSAIITTSQSIMAAREAFSSFSKNAFSLVSTPVSSDPSDLNNVPTAAGPSSINTPLYDDRRFTGYVIGSAAFAHDHSSGDHNGSGTTGMFYRLSDEVAIGAGITGGSSKRELRLEGESRVNSYGGNINFAYEGSEGFRVYATAGASALDIAMDRNYLNGAGIDESRGETDGMSYGAALQVGYALPITDTLNIMPYGTIETSKTKIDGYTETGGGFPAIFNDRETSLVTSRLGAEVSFNTGEDMEIRARAAWGHILSENGDDLSATVINLPQSIAYQEGEQNWIEGGVTFSWNYMDDVRVVADISGRSGQDTDTAASATLGVTFGF